MSRPAPWLASIRLRMLFRGAFLLLVLASFALALYMLNEERQRGFRSYRSSLVKTKDQIAARLRHPAGQLALLNPRAGSLQETSLHPVLLPYSALDFDDQRKVRNAVEMAGCLIRYADRGAVCVAIGSDPWAGGFIYVVGQFRATALVPHQRGERRLDGAHRLQVALSLRDENHRWVAPFEQIASASDRSGAVSGRLTGFVETAGDYARARPVKDFRGWIWQSAQCAEASAGEDCPREAFFSLRLPVDALRDALFRKERPSWPPADLDRIDLHVRALAPGGDAVLFDSAEQVATRPFALSDLSPLLLPGEKLRIAKADRPDELLAEVTGSEESRDADSTLLSGLIRRLPVDGLGPTRISERIATTTGTYTIELTGDAQSIDRSLVAVATRLSGFVAAMLAAILVAWLVIELGIIHRIGVLATRTGALTRNLRSAADLEHFELSELRGGDELGILATGLDDLLQRVKQDVQRERIRARQERDMWHAVGHEIMSPLQSLMALHAGPEDASRRYIDRMQQAVRILYGSASPSEAFESSTLTLARLDLSAFLRQLTDNAACVGIDDVRLAGDDTAISVRADEHSLEDVVTHVLRNAQRHREPGTPITIRLSADEGNAQVSIHNRGQPIAADMLDRIFEYGVSDQLDSAAQGHRGQGLFVARTYMAKMGGTIKAENTADGVRLVLSLPRLTHP